MTSLEQSSASKHIWRIITSIIIHQTHYENSDFSRAFNQFTIACELDMINAISAADIAFIMSSSTSAWLLSPLECSPQKQNGGTLRVCFWGWIMWKMQPRSQASSRYPSEVEAWDWARQARSPNKLCGWRHVKTRRGDWGRSCEKCIIKQLLDEVEHDIMNYQNRGLCYLGFGR